MARLKPNYIMEDKQVLIKTIKKSFEDKIKAGITWFKFISAINDINLTKRELELLAFINYRGTISSTSSKEEFCRIFDSSSATVSNMTAKLLKQKLLVKDKAKARINPALRVDFDKSFVVRFFIDVKKPIQDGD
jgi:hypothetical protein